LPHVKHFLQGDSHILRTKLVATLGSTSKSIFPTWERLDLLYWTGGTLTKTSKSSISYHYSHTYRASVI